MPTVRVRTPYLRLRPSRRPSRPLLAAVALAAVVFAGACSSSNEAAGSGNVSTGTQIVAGSSPSTGQPAGQPAVVYPGAQWTLVDPASRGLDPAPLAAVTGAVAGSDTDCVAVVKGGELVHESTYNGVIGETDQVVFSVSKSITSILVGIAQDQGKLRIDQRASDFVTEWKGTPSEPVTIKQLLSMTSGRHFDYQGDFITQTGSPDRSAYAVGLDQQHPPGTVWQYNNAGVQVLEVILRRATGAEVPAFATEFLFGPIGAQVDWALDKAGHPMTYAGAKMSCRDLARVGLLFQRKGRWNDRQVVSEAWVAESTRTSQDLDKGYGYLWWLNVEATRPGTDGTGTAPSASTPTGPTRTHPELAADAFQANGARGQFILVAPTEDLVIVRTGRDAASGHPLANPGGVLRHVVAQTLAAIGAGSR